MRTAIAHRVSGATIAMASLLILMACATGAKSAPIPPNSPPANLEPTLASTPTAEPKSTATEVTTFEHGKLGAMLVDSEGRSLYLLTEDERNVSTCTGACADAWVPLLTEVDPIAGEGVDASRLGTISRDDGALQVTYNGRALYHFAGHSATVGEANGQGTGGVWFVVSPDGSAIQTAAVVNEVEHNDLGAMLTDAAGRSLYLSARDRRGVSNCTGVCARVWPPLLTVDDPVAGDGVPVEPLGTISRRDGSRQVTYDGRPLHQFAGDDKPGDANGHDMGDVWFVVNPKLPLMFALGEQNNSGQSGWATLTPVGDHTLIVLNRSTGSLAQEAAHIREAPCGNGTLGAVVYTLTFFVDGSGSSVSTVHVSLDRLQSGDFAINSHINDYTRRRSLFPIYSDAENLEGGPAVSTSCGNIPVETDSITIALDELNDSGQSGRATLIARGNQTEVVLALSLGALHTEAVYIHRGPCGNETPGRVAYPLTSLVGAAGSSITTLDVPLASLRTGEFAISSHANGSETGRSPNRIYSDGINYAKEAAFFTACGIIPEGH